MKFALKSLIVIDIEHKLRSHLSLVCTVNAVNYCNSESLIFDDALYPGNGALTDG